MKPTHFWIALILLLVSLPLSACSPAATGAQKISPAQLEEMKDGTDRKRVILTERAAQRIDLQTAPVEVRQVNGADRKVVPYAAVLYDTAGGTWVYANPEGLSFVREPVVIESIDGDQAILSDGLAAGGRVVTVGVAELFGAETGVSK